MTDLPIAGKLVPLLQTGVVADAGDIATTDSGNLQTDLTNLDMAILHWRFNGTVVDASNPGATFLALNNVSKDLATIISFNVVSNVNSARFTEMLQNLRDQDRIFLQQRNAVNNSVLYRVTGTPTLDGTKVNVAVARERDQGTEFVDQSDLNVIFFKGTSEILDEVTKNPSTFNFSGNVQVLDQNLTNVRLPTNAPYDQVARYLFGGASIEANDVADRVEYSQGYSLGIDYRDNAQGAVNDADHYVDSAITVVGNLASNTLTYPAGTSFERLIATRIQLNPGSVLEGAMVVLLSSGGTEFEFMHINTSNIIEIDTEPASGTGTHATVTDGLGDIVLDDGSWVLMEMVPLLNGNANDWEVIVSVLKADGTRISANNINVDLTGVSGERLGFSRSSNQRGQITQFKAIQEPGYLSHSQLRDLWDHVDDKWDFGFARLYSAGSENLVNIVTKLKGPIESTIGVPLPTVPTAGQIVRINAAGNGYEAVELSRDITSAISGLVLTLPADYADFELLTVSVSEDGGETLPATISTRTLDAGNITALNIGRDDNAAWVESNRTLTLSASDSWVTAVLSVPKQ